jgi:hypothetical protein
MLRPNVRLRNFLSFTLILLAATLFAAALSTQRSQAQPQPNPQPAASRADSLAAWTKIATVLDHPRCLNCHQAESPLQGDSRRAHIPHVVRGSDNHGVGAMRCGNCHNGIGNNDTSRTPGAGGKGSDAWELAPLSMLWQGLSEGDLCRAVKDPARNGHRNGEALIKHMTDEPLVLYGWDPGVGRAPVPIPHDEVVSLMKVWVAGGMACPK